MLRIIKFPEASQTEVNLRYEPGGKVAQEPRKK